VVPLNLEIEPETIIDLKKSYITSGYELGRKICGGVGTVVGYPVAVAVNGLNSAYNSIIEQKRREEQKRVILETLKEGKAMQGEPQSCIIQVDEQCMLDRAKRNKE